MIQMLYDAAVAKNVVVAVEVHKRLDQMYTDARDRIQKLGIHLLLCYYHHIKMYSFHSINDPTPV